MKRLATGALLAGVVIGFSATAAVAGAPGARAGDTSAVQTRPSPVGHQTLGHTPRCALLGTWDNAYGGVITMSTNRKGTYAASYCGSPWNVRRTARSRAGFSVAMTYTGTDGCQNFTETMLWNGCSQANGTYTNASGGTGPDTWNAAAPGPVK